MSPLSVLLLALTLAAPPAADTSLDAAHGLLARGHHALAEAEYRAYLDADPDPTQREMAWYGLGVALFQQTKHNEAIEALARLERADEFTYAAEVGTMLGRAHLAEGRPDEALTPLERVVTRFGTHELADDAGSAIVEAHIARDDANAALTAADDFRRRWPGSVLIPRTEELAARAEMMLGRDRAAAERLAALPGDMPAARRLLLAQLWHRASETDRAIAAYEAVLQGEPGPLAGDASYGLAQVLHASGRYDDAIRRIERHLRRYETHLAAARILHGRCWLDAGEPDRAVRHFQQLMTGDDTPADETIYWLGRSQLAAGDTVAAERTLAKAVREHARSPLATEMRHDRAVALLQLDRADDALETLAPLKLPATHDLASSVTLLRAQADHHAGRYERSRERCRRLTAATKDKTIGAAARFLIVENDYLEGDLAAAARGYTTFIESFPNAPERTLAELRLGLALVALGETEAARPWLTRSATQAGGPYADAQLALADLAYDASRWEDARTAYADYLNRHDGDDEVTAGVRLRQALAARRLGDDETAERELTRLVRGDVLPPHRAAARYELALIAQTQKQLRVAERHLDRILADDGETPFASRAAFVKAGLTGDAKAAAALYADAARRAEAAGETDIVIEARFQQAQMLFATEAFAEAAGVFETVALTAPAGPRAAEATARRAIALARTDPAAAVEALRAAEGRGDLDPVLRTAVLYELAWAYRSADAIDDAVAAYERLLAQAGDDARAAYARIELADLALAAGDPARAAAWLQPLLRDPSAAVRPDVLYRLGVAAFRQGDQSAAASHLEAYVREVKAGPLVPAARLLAGEALADLGAHGRVVDMLEPLRQIEGVDDETLDASLVRLGESYAAVQQWARSERRFAEHLERFPEADRWPHARFGRGWARENQGRTKDAMTDYEILVAGHEGPLAARGQFQIGECLFAEKELEAAVRAFLKVDILYAYPEWSAAALYEAGRCFEGLGDAVQARLHYLRVQTQHDDTEWARLATDRLRALEKTGLPGR